MANRQKDFNELLALQFEDLDFSKAYIMSLINDEGLAPDQALRETIVAMGLQAFSKKSGLRIQYVSDFVNKRKKMTIKTLGKHLKKVFNLRVKLLVEPLGKNAA